MIRPQPVPPIDGPGQPVASVVAVGVRPRCESLISRVLLAILLAAVAALIPGEASKVLDVPLTWSDLFGRL